MISGGRSRGTPPALAGNAERGGNDATEDAVNNDATMVEDAPWGTGARGLEAEEQLRRKLEERFAEAFKGRNYK